MGKISRRPGRVDRKSNALEAPRSDGERAAMAAAQAAYRRAQQVLRAAKDPAASKVAFQEVIAAGDAVTTAILTHAEQEILDDEDEEPERFAQDGRCWKRVLQGPARYTSTRGTYTVARGRYRDGAMPNGPTRCPYEERRGIGVCGYLPDVLALVVEGVARMPATAASDLLRKALGFTLPPSTMKKVATEIGGTLRALEPELFAQCFPRHPVPEAARTVVISEDGLHIPMRKEGYKQGMVATISLLAAHAERVSTIFLSEMPEAGKATLHARVAKEVAAILRQRPDLQTEVVIDGARDLREAMEGCFPGARHVTDFFHVVEHLCDALGHLYPDDPARRAQEKARWCEALKHRVGTAFDLHAWLWAQTREAGAVLSSWRRGEVEKHAEYIYGQRAYLTYPAAANDGMALGSGIVEAGGKTVFTQRLKISGATWSYGGGAAITYARELLLSDRLDEALAYWLHVQTDHRPPIAA